MEERIGIRVGSSHHTRTLQHLTYNPSGYTTLIYNINKSSTRYELPNPDVGDCHVNAYYFRKNVASFSPALRQIVSETVR